MRRLIALSILTLLWTAPARTEAAAQETFSQKAILVTGASTGIGRKITEHLTGKGYFVYAGARKDSDLKALGALKNVQAVRLDVTRHEDIAAAVDTITKGGRGLYGLINNAGVVVTGPVAQMSLQDLKLVMDVNVYGPYLVTQAFIPLITAQKGRIVTIGSIAAFLTGAGGSAYSMTKAAMEVFTDALAQEMEPLGVHVSIIEPGGYKSEIMKTAAKRKGIEWKSEESVKAKEPDEVAAAAALALFEPNPKRRYMVVPNESDATNTIKRQITQLVQVNEGQPYTYDRKTLIKMLDEALEHSRPRTP